MKSLIEVYGVLLLSLLVVAGVGVYAALVNYSLKATGELSSTIASDSARRSEKVYLEMEGERLKLTSTTSLVVRDILVYDATGILFENNTSIRLQPGETVEYFLPGQVASAVSQGAAFIGVYTERGSFITWSPLEQTLTRDYSGFTSTRVHVVYPEYTPRESVLFEYNGSGVIQGVTIYSYYTGVNITRILVDGMQVNTAPVVVGRFGLFTPAQISSLYIPLNARFTSGVQIYGTVLPQAGGFAEVVITISSL